MNPDTSPGAVLRDLLAQHGQQLAFDAETTHRLLSQACPTAAREVDAIVAAQRLRIPWELLNSGAEIPAERLDELARSLCDQTQMPEDAARWIIQTWMQALDLKVLEVEGPLQEPSEGDLAEAHLDAPADAAPAPGAPTPAPTPGPAASTVTYYVLGDGGAKYGPADVDTLNRWAAEGRLHAGSLLEENGTGRTVRVHEVAGLFVPGAQNPQPPGQPGPSPFGQPPGGQPGPYSQPGQGPYGQMPGQPGLRPEGGSPYAQAPQYGTYYRPIEPDPKLDKLATWALVVSIIGFLANCCIGLIALIFTVLGRSDMGKGDYTGAKSKMTIGLVFGIIAIALGLVLLPVQIMNFEKSFNAGFNRGYNSSP